MAEKKEMHVENLKKVNEILNEGKLRDLSVKISDYVKNLKTVKADLDEKIHNIEVQKESQASVVENTDNASVIQNVVEKDTPSEIKVDLNSADKNVKQDDDLSNNNSKIETEKKLESKNNFVEKIDKVFSVEIKEANTKDDSKKAELKIESQQTKENTVKEPIKEQKTPETKIEKNMAEQKILKEEKPNTVQVEKENTKTVENNPVNPNDKAKTVSTEKTIINPAEKPRPSFIVRREYVPENNARENRTYDRNRNDRQGYRPQPYGQNRPQNFGENRPQNGEKRPYAQNGEHRPYSQTQNGERRPYTQNGERRPYNTTGNYKPGFNKKPQTAYIAPPIVANTTEKRTFNKKAKIGEKSFEEKHVISKRALIKESVDIDDFDENKTGYRKFRPIKKAKEQVQNNVIKIEKAVITSEIIPLKVLSDKIGVTATEITKKLFKEGIMKTINDSIDFDTAEYIADGFGVTLELKVDKTAEDVLSEGFDTDIDSEEKLVTRPPVVTVMGHVDHGKTSILDRIRKTNVTAGEAGGITQHIGAYQVTIDGKVITFLDTPGHAAFTAMRARGAQATDIAVLVVAADDGIMPQTIEAISHAKAANVPIIVAINKIDKPEANIERIKNQLTEHDLLPEEWGGDTILCPVSAKTGEGIKELLASINLVAEIKDYRANPNRKAKAIVIEAKLDQSKGPVANILIKNGTLNVSDNVIVGTVTGKIRAMVDDKGRKIHSAGPSMPVSIMGLDDVPTAGDILYAGDEDKLIKLVAEERKNKERESMIKEASKISLDDVFKKISEGEIKGLNLIVKADVQGSVEAVRQSLEKLSNEEVKVNVIHAQVGAIKESDIMLAESSHAIIIGFNVRPDSNAKQIAERSGVDIKLYRIIYEAIEDVQKALKGMLAPKFNDVYLGKAEVREVFKISGVGQVAGCYVTEGKISKTGKLRIYRNDVMICEGNVLQLKRFKDDVKEVTQGFECGISIEKFNDIKVGDFIESYQVEESKE